MKNMEVFAFVKNNFQSQKGTKHCSLYSFSSSSSSSSLLLLFSQTRKDVRKLQKSENYTEMLLFLVLLRCIITMEKDI